MIIDPNGMWEQDADGNRVAERGDSWWKLHKQTGMSWKETMTYAKEYNAGQGRDNWKTVRVGDRITLPEVKPVNSNSASNLAYSYSHSQYATSNSSKQSQSKNKVDSPTGGRTESFSVGFALGGWYELEFGNVRDGSNNVAWYFTHGPTVGFYLGSGFNYGAISPNTGIDFVIEKYSGSSSGYTLGFGFTEFGLAGDRSPQYDNSDWSLGSGANYNELRSSVGAGVDIGLKWSRTKTILIQ